MMERVKHRAQAPRLGWHGPCVHRFASKIDPSLEFHLDPLEGGRVGKEIGEGDCGCKSVHSQLGEKGWDRAGSARTKVNDVRRAAHPQHLDHQRHCRPMQRKFCLDEMQVIGRQIPDQGREPRLILKFK